MSKMLTLFTISAFCQAAGKLPEKQAPDTASLCLKSCDKVGNVESFGFGRIGRLGSYPQGALEKPGAHIAQKEFFATNCGSDPQTTIEALFQQAGEVIKKLSASRRMHRTLSRRSVRKVQRLQSKIQEQTQAILSTVADIKERVSIPAAEMSGGLPGARKVANPAFSMEKITEKIVGITSTDLLFSNALSFDKIAEKYYEKVYFSVGALTKQCASDDFAKLLVIINIMEADETSMPLCHAKVLMALTLQSLEIEWKKLKSEVNSAGPVSYQQERKVYNFYAQANMLRDIDLDMFVEEGIIAEKMMF